MPAGRPHRSVGSGPSLPSMDGSPVVARGLPNPHQNHLLDALPANDYARVASHLELIPMKLGDVLYESGAMPRYVYFPTTSIISLLYVMEDGASAEIAIVGNEGVLGISLFMGGDTTPSRAVVQSAGFAYRLQAQLFKEEFARFGPTMHLLLRYTQALITQMAQTRGLQSAPFRRPAIVPVAVAEFGSIGVKRALHDAGIDRQHARRTP